MANKALEILEDNTRLEEFKRQARIQAEKFDINNIVPAYELLYKKVIQSPKTMQQ
jgi:hypothetical protein